MSLRHHHTLGQGMTSARARARMVAQLREQGISNAQVLAVMGRVERHRFVEEALSSRAYDNSALPIGYGQTISQPLVVARMTEWLLTTPEPPRAVLEVGTGCGYQTAVLAALGITVYSTERIRPLHEMARARLRALGYTKVRLRLSDGSMGLPDYAPFDAIMVTAGGASVPQSLCEQLCDGGVLVMPVGSERQQQLVRVQRSGTQWQHSVGELVSFVPLLTGISSGKQE